MMLTVSKQSIQLISQNNSDNRTYCASGRVLRNGDQSYSRHWLSSANHKLEHFILEAGSGQTQFDRLNLAHTKCITEYFLTSTRTTRLLQIVITLFRRYKVLQYRAPEKIKFFKERKKKTCLYYNGEDIFSLHAEGSELLRGKNTVQDTFSSKICKASKCNKDVCNNRRLRQEVGENYFCKVAT